MSVSSYQKNGQTLWQVYVDIKSKRDRRIRVQKRINGLATEKLAVAEEKRLTKELLQKLSELELQGLKWRDVIDRWERYQELYPSKRYAQTTIEDYTSLLRNWTHPWLDRNASDINRGDARALFNQIRDEGKSASFCKHLKNTISLFYTWGIEERLINGVRESPVYDLEIERDREEKLPEILNLQEIRELLRLAKEQQHPWYPVWVSAVYTGCRSGELQALLRNDVDIISREEAKVQNELPPEQRRYGLIRIRRNWNSRLKKLGPTKAGYWRTVPISSEYYWFLVNELKVESLGADDLLLPNLLDWRLGLQATILRGFCQANGITSVKFHTLRACFATHLIASGVPGPVVMKIAGWRDVKTMQRYIRLAGIEEHGATEKLKFSGSIEAAIEKVMTLKFNQK